MSVAGWQVTLSVEEGREKGLSYPMTKAKTILGRAKADVVLQDSKISSRHAVIEISEEGVFIRDLDSRNGVFVNGTQVPHKKLKNLDEITLGLTKMKILMVEDLGAFRERNTSQKGPSASAEGGRDIKNLINDELGKFSKWDLAEDGDPDDRSELDIVRLGYALEVIEGPDRGTRFILNRPLMTLGRGKAEIILKDLDVSRLHACLEISPKGRVRLRDLGSTNGIEAGGRRVMEAQLKLQDEFRMGNTVCRLVGKK